MKKTIYHLAFRFFLIFSVQSMVAQEYHSMPVADAGWHITRCWYFYPGGWHDEYTVELNGEDTILNGKVFKKLDIVTHHAPGTEYDSVYTHFLGGMREENKQVFFFSEYLCLDTIARMLYDFNDVDPGDTIFTQVLTNGLTHFIPHIVTSVDEVQIGAEDHRRINLKDENGIFSDSWIEGVGSTLGLIYPGYWLLTDNSYDLNCFYHQGGLQFRNPSPAYLFCTFPLPNIVCDSVITAVSDETNNAGFRIYPNPAKDNINIESPGQFQHVRILNVWGQCVLTSSFTHEMAIHSLHPGFYIIQITGANDRLLANIKFIKT